MNTADYALIVSMFSAVISLAALGWNIWSKFIYPKAKLRVHFAAMTLFIQGVGANSHFITLGATNHGPTEVTLHTAIITVKATRWWRRHSTGLVNPLNNPLNQTGTSGPFSGGLPKKLAVGEAHTVYFPYDAKTFARERLRTIGFVDVFGRVHWAPKKTIKAVKAQLEKDFGDIAYEPQFKEP